jgi:predicted deacetylase
MSRHLVVSFHDLSPRCADVCDRFLAGLSDRGVERAALLVVPCLNGGPPVHEDAAFCRRLKGWEQAGHEICLHGWLHHAPPRAEAGFGFLLLNRYYSAGEAEFLGIDGGEAARRLAAGRRTLARAGCSAAGFVAPAWLMCPETPELVKRAGFRYTTTWGGIIDLAEGRAVRAPVLTASTRTAWRRAVSRIWLRTWYALQRNAPVMRIAVHPADLAFPAVRDVLLYIIGRAAATREAVTYAQLLTAMREDRRA